MRDIDVCVHSTCEWRRDEMRDARRLTGGFRVGVQVVLGWKGEV